VPVPQPKTCRTWYQYGAGQWGRSASEAPKVTGPRPRLRQYPSCLQVARLAPAAEAFSSAWPAGHRLVSGLAARKVAQTSPDSVARSSGAESGSLNSPPGRPEAPSGGPRTLCLRAWTACESPIRRSRRRVRISSSDHEMRAVWRPWTPGLWAGGAGPLRTLPLVRNRLAILVAVPVSPYQLKMALLRCFAFAPDHQNRTNVLGTSGYPRAMECLPSSAVSCAR